MTCLVQMVVDRQEEGQSVARIGLVVALTLVGRAAAVLSRLVVLAEVEAVRNSEVVRNLEAVMVAAKVLPDREVVAVRMGLAQ